MLGGSCGLLLVGALRGELAAFEPSAVSSRSLFALLYLVVFGSIVGLSAYSWLLRVTTPAAVSTYAFVNPVVALLLGLTLAGEAIGARAALASCLILGGVTLLLIERAQRNGRGRDRDRARRSPPQRPIGTETADAA
jgi:drug/metabolite transporter (DMT)-like permease